jgi:hypothetical protein
MSKFLSTNGKLIALSVTINTLTAWGAYSIGFNEDALVGLGFWAAAMVGILYQVYACKHLPGRLRLIPLAPAGCILLITVAAVSYFFNI